MNAQPAKRANDKRVRMRRAQRNISLISDRSRLELRRLAAIRIKLAEGLCAGGSGFEEWAERCGVDQQKAIFTFRYHDPALDAAEDFIEGDSPDLRGHVRDDPTGHSFAPCKPS